MENLALLDEYYKKYMGNINTWLPDGIIDVNLLLLQKLNLLEKQELSNQNSRITSYFHIIKTNKKITLINEKFMVGIVPERIDETVITYTLIALNTPGQPHPELAFMNQGVYNSSKLILNLLEKFLKEIQENEEMIKKLESA